MTSSFAFVKLSVPGQLRMRLQRWCAELERKLENAFWPTAVAATAILFICFLVTDIRLKMWNDELFTLYYARLSGPGQIVAALMDGAETTPPFYTMLVQAILPCLASNALAIRLPATLGFCVMVLATIAFAHRRLPAVYALVAGLLAAAMAIYYGSEGRGYGLVLGFASVSLLSWSVAADGRKRIVTIPSLVVSIAAIVATHYYAIFFALCLLFAELMRARAKRQVDLTLAAAIFIPPAIVLAVHYPLIAAARPFQAHFWAQAGLGAIANYNTVPLLWPIALIVVAMLAATFVPIEFTRQPRVAIPSHECTALALFALAPFSVDMAAMATTHVFTDRYVLWSLIGVAVLSALLLSLFSRNNPVIEIAVLAVLGIGLVTWEAVSVTYWSSLRESGVLAAALEKLPDDDSQIVVPDAHTFVELSYYVPATLRQRLVYPICNDLDLRYLGYDTDALLMSGLKHWTNLDADSCDTILHKQRAFIVAATPKDYLPWVLAANGRSVVPIDSGSKAPVLFWVSMSGRAQ
jgi:hypothetical protein